MGLTPKERKANQRARDAGFPEPYQAKPAAPKATKEEVETRLSQHASDFAWAQEQDATETFYKSECRPCVDLLAIYEGANIEDKEAEDDEETSGSKKKSKKKQNRPNPSLQRLTIRAIESEGFRIEPDAALSFRKVFEVNEVVSFRRWLDLRDKGRKDIFWLGRLLGKNLYYEVHHPVCDMFVQKNFDGMYFPGFNQDDLHAMIKQQKRVAMDGVTPTRTMILMAPRSGYKSTIDGIDATSWLLNCPDIRIMIITAFRNLAKTFLREIKKYFFLPRSAQPTAFHMLYPEFILTGVDGTSEQALECPAHVLNSKEPHLWITSMESSATGLRCDIRKMDDIVDPKNSNDEELRAELKYKIDGTNDLVEPWGFTDVAGTRYFTQDWYGMRMAPDENGDPAPYAYLHIPAWKPKKEFEAQYAILLRTEGGMYKVTEDMVDLWFPQKLSFEHLKNTLKEKKERSFKNQQLNIATDPKVDDVYINLFDKDVLDHHTTTLSAATLKDGEIIQTWDIAYGEKRTSDYSVGITAKVIQNTDKQLGLHILEIIFDKWKNSELPYHMLSFYERWKPNRVRIENSNGVGFLMNNIRNLARSRGSDIEHHVQLWPVDVSPNAKRNRIKDAEFLLGHDRLFFVGGPWMQETNKQLTEYSGKKSTTYRKDDIPDALGLTTTFLPAIALVHSPDPKEVEKAYEERVQTARTRALYDRMFMDRPQLREAMTRTQWEAQQRGDPQFPEPEEPKPDPRRALMNKFFGGNGMRA
jgi:hypothetical protein